MFPQIRRYAHSVPWSPWRIPLSQRAGWWSAEDAAIAALMTDDGGGLISSWKSRNTLLDLTATLAARGQYSAAGFAGAYPAVSGDGVAVSMALASTTGLPTGAVPGAIMLLGTDTGVVASTRTAMAYGGATSNQRGLAKNAAAAARVSDGSTTVAFGAWTGPGIVAGYWSGTTEWGRLNGTQSADTTIATLATATTRTRLFSTNATTPGGFWSGPIPEFLILANPTLGLIQQIEGYWAWKYPLAGLVALLPADHPYKSGPP